MSDEKAALWDARYVHEGYETQSLAAYTDVVRELILQSKEVLHSLDIRDGRLLDVAGGTGKHARFFDLTANGNSLSLVDFSREAVAVARSAGIDATVCDLESQELPFPDQHFHLVMAQEIIEHLSDCGHLLDEACRVLRADGYLYITTPNLAGLIDRIFLLRGKKPLAMTWDPTHIRLYLFSEIEGMLRSRGLEIVNSTTQGVYLCFRKHFFRLPGVSRMNRRLGQHIMILARKMTIL